eukprot:14070164-Ditylum_brightwellii.AAC.1
MDVCGDEVLGAECDEELGEELGGALGVELNEDLVVLLSKPELKLFHMLLIVEAELESTANEIIGLSKI